MGDNIVQWEEEDVCLANSCAGVSSQLCKSQLSKPFLPVLLALKTGTFSCPHAGLVSCVSY